MNGSLKDEQSATAKLDRYLARTYPHLFSPTDLPLSNGSKGQDNLINCGHKSSSSAYKIRLDDVIGDCPKLQPQKTSFSVIKERDSRVASFTKSLQQTELDDYELLSSCSSPRLASSDDDCEKFFHDDNCTSSLSDSDDQVVNKNFNFTFQTGFFARKSRPTNESIESKVEEFLSEYRDGLESSWFRTPDQSKLFDFEFSDLVATPPSVSGSESPDIVEAVWRCRRRSLVKDGQKRRQRCSST